MLRKFLISLAILTIVTSVVLPFIFKPDDLNFFSWKVVIAMTLMGLIVGSLYIILLAISKRQKKGAVYIAYHFANAEFVQSLKERLKSMGYRCYPDLSALISGSRIKDLNITTQIDKSELLIVLLSNVADESHYISYIVKIFKRQGKPIQIYTIAGFEDIPEYLKSYIIFQLPSDRFSALSMITRFVNGLFVGKQLRENKTL